MTTEHNTSELNLLKVENEALRAALKAVHALISEAASTGFDPIDGTWAERLFRSQAQTYAALNNTPTNGEANG